MVTTELPLWALVTISVGSPVLSFAGSLVGPLLSRRSAREEDGRSRRVEVMQTLRWAAELAVDADDDRARLGLNQLRALSRSPLVDDVGQRFVDAALYHLVRRSRRTLAKDGPVADVVELFPDGADVPESMVGNLESGEEEKGGDDDG